MLGTFVRSSSGGLSRWSSSVLAQQQLARNSTSGFVENTVKSLTSLFGSQQPSKKMSNTVEEATFDIEPYKLHLLEEGPPQTATLTREEGLKYYKDMVVVRRMETAAANLYKEKVIRGFCHLCSGQEAVCVGIKGGLRDFDSVITSYRAHGFAYVMGISVLGVLSELTGKVSGCVRGTG